MPTLMKFLCPNGHQLSTSVDRAGKPGQCPKCGVKFLVPESDDADDAAAEGEAANGNARPKTAPAGETIEFLCPNGHRLSGPARLQGKPGQCPHCRTKFHIPSYNEEEVADVEEIEEIEEIEVVDEIEVDDEAESTPADEQPRAVAAASRSPSGSGAGSGLDFLAALDTNPNPSSHSSALRSRNSKIGKIGPIMGPGSDVHDAPVSAGSQAAGSQAAGSSTAGSSTAGSSTAGSSASGSSASGQSAAAPHPLAEVFARFWKQRGKEGVIELHLNDGKVVTPKRFSRRLSQPQFGVFALDDSDGTHALVTIPWSAVAQLHLRGLKRIPDGVFD